MNRFFERHIRVRNASTFFFVSFLALSLALAVRGLPGNPTALDMMANESWRAEGPLELSPERGRFALLYSIAEDGTPFFSLPVARLATPDLARNPDGKFVSLFAPLLSFLLLPGYFVGKMLGASVVGAISMIALSAILNALLIRSIAIRLGAGSLAASVGAVAFLFGTPAFSYGTTLYQHHVSVLLLLLSIFLLVRWKSFWALSAVAFLAGCSISLDNPNAFLFLPIVLWGFTRILWIEPEGESQSIRILFRPLFLGVVLAAMLPLAFLFQYNESVNGSPWKLSGTLPGVPALSSDGHALDHDPSQRLEPGSEQNEEKTAVGFFETRSLLNGFFIHLLSPDRGVIRFAPSILFGIFGFALLYKRRRSEVANGIIGVSLVTLVVYSLWGDPWGGWAFGSRYLIPAYAMLGIGVALFLERWKTSLALLGVFSVALAFSIGTNTLGALTSNANPPQVQVLELEALSGKEQKYTIDRNWQYLTEVGSKSFVYHVYASRFATATTYYWSVFSFILLGALILCGMLAREGLRKAGRL